MLTGRLTSLNDEEIVYHYCSAETFLAIIGNHTLRFSDVNMMNDAEEQRWGYLVFEEAANRILKRPDRSEVPLDIQLPFINHIDAIWSGLGLRLATVLTCFSTNGDSLSQWRAYADDGRGFAIGFPVAELKRLPVTILDVEYDHERQIVEMIKAIERIYTEFSENGGDHTQPWFFERCTLLATTSLAFKNPAWRDEKEVRCVHIVHANIQQNRMSLVDPGGISHGQEVTGQVVRFQAKNGAIVPFIDIPFDISDERRPINEVVLGPKCPNAFGNILFAMGNAGFQGVTVRKASAAYR